MGKETYPGPRNNQTWRHVMLSSASSSPPIERSVEIHTRIPREFQLCLVDASISECQKDPCFPGTAELFFLYSHGV